MLPVIVAGIAVPIVVAFAIAGPGLGLAVGALAVLALVVVAVRTRPDGRIEVATSPDRRRRILVVLAAPIEDEASVGEIAAAAGVDEEGAAAEVVVLAPARSRFLDRWATDLTRAREAAQRNLVISVASLAKAEVEASASVGDEDLVQATEDRLRLFPATEVILATPAAGEDPRAAAAARRLRSRLDIPFRHVQLGGAEPS
jgi:hypothetical protein